MHYVLYMKMGHPGFNTSGLTLGAALVWNAMVTSLQYATQCHFCPCGFIRYCNLTTM